MTPEPPSAVPACTGRGGGCRLVRAPEAVLGRGRPPLDLVAVTHERANGMGDEHDTLQRCGGCGQLYAVSRTETHWSSGSEDVSTSYRQVDVPAGAVAHLVTVDDPERGPTRYAVRPAPEADPRSGQGGRPSGRRPSA